MEEKIAKEPPRTDPCVGAALLKPVLLAIRELRASLRKHTSEGRFVTFLDADEVSRALALLKEEVTADRQRYYAGPNPRPTSTAMPPAEDALENINVWLLQQPLRFEVLDALAPEFQRYLDRFEAMFADLCGLESETPDRLPPLTDLERVLLFVLIAELPTRGLTSGELTKGSLARGQMTSDTAVRRLLVKASKLRRYYGVEGGKGTGYFLPLSVRGKVRAALGPDPKLARAQRGHVEVTGAAGEMGDNSPHDQPQQAPAAARNDGGRSRHSGK